VALGYAWSMPAAFGPDVLDLLARTEEVEVETRAPRDGEVHRTIIWVVVEGNDVFIRSVRGAGARWYRELTAAGQGALIVGNRRIPFRAVPAADPDSVERCSGALRAKYAGVPGIRPMLRAPVLSTTLRLEPG
jgi:hypothetical protein